MINLQSVQFNIISIISKFDEVSGQDSEEENTPIVGLHQYNVKR